MQAQIVHQKEIANRLKQARVKAGFNTAKAFAQTLRIPLSTYTKHENGQRNINYDVLQKYAKILKANITWLLTGNNKDRQSINMENHPIDTELLEYILNRVYKISQGKTHKNEFKNMIKIAVSIYESVIKLIEDNSSQRQIAETLINTLLKTTNINI